MSLELKTNLQPDSAFAPPAVGLEVNDDFFRSWTRFVRVGDNEYQVLSGIHSGKVIKLSQHQRSQLLEVEVFTMKISASFEDTRGDTRALTRTDRLVLLQMEGVYLFVHGPHKGRRVEAAKIAGNLKKVIKA